MKKLIPLIILSLLFACRIFAQNTPSDTLVESVGYPYRINDVHCHYVDFVQETDGLGILLEKMDSAEVDHIVLFGLPVTKMWTDYDRERPIYYDDNDAPAYYYSLTDVILAEAIKTLPGEQQERIYPMICGFNPVDQNGLDHIKRMVAMYPGLWVGIGEIFFRHDDLSRMTYGRTPTADCRSMEPVYEYAAAQNLPIWIHSDIGDPVSNKPTFLYEMEETIKNHPNTRMVWCHIGDTRHVNVDGFPEMTRRLLQTYPNLYYDISWVVFEQIIAPAGKPDPEWVAILEQFPTRFMIGTDLIGNFSDYVQTIRKYDMLLNALTPETARRLASENMYELLPRRPKPKNYNPTANNHDAMTETTENPEKTTTAVTDQTPKVTGIGGIFFKAKDPKRMMEWYGSQLGLAVTEYGSPFEFRNANRPDEINYLNWSPFQEETDYFAPSEKEFMINYRVQNIEGLVNSLRANGVTIVDEIESYDYGKFVHIMDPGGNKIELWEPVDSVFTRMGGPTTK